MNPLHRPYNSQVGRLGTDVATAIVAEINERHGTSYTLTGLLGGQAQHGWSVLDAEGRPWVLKFNDHPGWRQQVQRFGAISTHLRAHRYPASAVVLQGPLSDGLYFFVQQELVGDRLDGFRDAPISADALELLLELLERHAGLAPDLTQSWSAYVRDATIGRQHEWAALQASGHGAIEAVLEAAAVRLAGLIDVKFSLDDFVTGDLGPHNTLVVGDTVTGVFDLEASGRGDRIIDLVLLLKWVDSEAMQERIFDVARQMGRARHFELADIYWALNELDGAYHSGDEERIERKARLALERLDRRVA